MRPSSRPSGAVGVSGTCFGARPCSKPVSRRGGAIGTFARRSCSVSTRPCGGARSRTTSSRPPRTHGAPRRPSHISGSRRATSSRTWPSRRRTTPRSGSRTTTPRVGGSARWMRRATRSSARIVWSRWRTRPSAQATSRAGVPSRRRRRGPRASSAIPRCWPEPRWRTAPRSSRPRWTRRSWRCSRKRAPRSVTPTRRCRRGARAARGGAAAGVGSERSFRART